MFESVRVMVQQRLPPRARVLRPHGYMEARLEEECARDKTRLGQVGAGPVAKDWRDESAGDRARGPRRTGGVRRGDPPSRGHADGMDGADDGASMRVEVLGEAAEAGGEDRGLKSGVKSIVERDGAVIKANRTLQQFPLVDAEVTNATRIDGSRVPRTVVPRRLRQLSRVMRVLRTSSPPFH